MNKIDILLQALDIFIENKHWPELKPSEIFKILFYTYNKGFLYTPIKDGQIQCIICAYRIKEVTDETLLKAPLKEEGNILYVPFFLSLNKNENMFKLVRESLNIYLEENPDIVELVLEDKNKKIKRYNLKGDANEISEAGYSSPTDISK